MKVVRKKSELKIANGTVVALGNFDGIHTGHAKILNVLTSRAAVLGVPSLVYTFEPHPMKLVSPKKSPALITLLDKKIELIKSFGIKKLVLARFDETLRRHNPREFVQRVLVDELHAKEVIIGHDFSFGRAKSGTAEVLNKLGMEKDAGFKVRIVPAHKKNGKVVSSSSIRELIRAGDISSASKLLGRDFELTGTVVRGRSIGKKLGFPTANIKTPSELMPSDGVYAALVRLGKHGKKLYPSVANIGIAPTFKRKKIILEVHLLDFKGSIYGKDIVVTFIKKIRNEKKFSSAEKLKQAIGLDIKKAKKILK
jgi:riboflavin kinase/FMN adenylyltransferase